MCSKSQVDSIGHATKKEVEKKKNGNLLCKQEIAKLLHKL